MKKSFYIFVLAPLFLSAAVVSERPRPVDDTSHVMRNESEINYDKIRYYEQGHLPFVGPRCENPVEDCRPSCPQGNR